MDPAVVELIGIIVIASLSCIFGLVYLVEITFIILIFKHLSRVRRLLDRQFAKGPEVENPE